MPNDITVTKNTTSGQERWDVAYTTDQSGTIDKTLLTAGKLMDRNIKVAITTPTDFVGSGITRKSATTYTPTTSDQTIASGTYLTGTQTISGDSNLTASNIKKDVSIFGVTGTYEGSGGPTDPKIVHFIDYDGTMLYEYTLAEANALNALPANPTHTGLLAQGWNWTLAEIKAQLLDNPNMPVVVGQLYTTSSGATELDIELDESFGLSPTLATAPNGTIDIDWGDGSTHDTVTGTSLSSAKYTTHTYATTGNYTIKISVTSGNFSFYSNSTSYPAIFKTSTSGADRYYGAKLKALRFGNNCIKCYYVCQFCENLVYVTLHNDVFVLNNSNQVSYAFRDCYNLKAITIPRKGYKDSSSADIISLHNRFFENCRQLLYVSLPPTITQIGDYLFQEDYKLSLVTIKNNISIGSRTFYNCYNLNIPLVSCIGFSDNTILPGDIITNSLINSVSISNTVVQVGGLGTARLENITISKYVTTLNSSAFASSKFLKTVTFESGSSLTTINYGAFQNCWSLTTINLPDTVTSLDTGSTFTSCYELKSIHLPNTITSIPKNTCQNCYSLTNIEIPNTVTSIEANAFYACYSLREIHFKPTTPPTVANSNAFSSLPKDCKIYVPTGSLSAYTGATNYPSSSSYTYVEE